jgi:putative glycosyltransferase (TIGR04348 family)
MKLRIQMLCPALPGSRSGNRITALRWSRFLRSLGHRVEILHKLDDPGIGARADVLVLLHAAKCASAAQIFRKNYPHRPLVVALTGTDLYHDLERQARARRSLELADRIILLQRSGLANLAPHLRRKSHVIHQSSIPVNASRFSFKRHFHVCVVGHLRAVKDPMRCALAVRSLPADSKIRVVQIGRAMTEQFAARALREDQINDRYTWLGEFTHAKTRMRIAQSHLLVLTSKMEGGANVISEACVAGVPILASRIEGSVGLLGEKHPGMFEVGNTRALRSLLLASENDQSFYEKLRKASLEKASDFKPDLERAAWRDLLKMLHH